VSIDLRVGALREPVSGRYFDAITCRQKILARAAVLQREGVGRGERVFLHYGNSAEFLFDIAACWLLGGCVVPLDPRLTAFEIETLKAAARPRVCVRNADRDPGEPVTDSSVVPRGLPVLDDDALMLFTSGTTGAPKGVVHSHRSLRSRWASQKDAMGVAVFARTLCVLPTNFAWGLVGNCLYSWLYGEELVLLPAFRTDVLLQLGSLCDEHQITYLPTVPSMWRTVLRMAAPPKKGTLKRIAACTAPLPASVWRDIGKWGSVDDVINIYAMTECGWMTWASSVRDTPEDGLVGVPFGCDVKVLPFGSTDQDVLFAEVCAPDETGYVWVRTPALMRGYLDRDDLTSQVMARGCFVTGDMGSIDARGRLFLRGRDKEMINVAGIKVYPADIDVAIERSGLVAEVCAFSVADTLQGEQVAVAIVLPEGAPEDLGPIYRRTRECLASHLMPKLWYRVGEIPRTARGKVNRQQVAAACEALRPADLRTLERE
jgi:acyl-CoA synthetase (AMP-forming)/AMP-acid ligase II